MARERVGISVSAAQHDDDDLVGISDRKSLRKGTQKYTCCLQNHKLFCYACHFAVTILTQSVA